MEGYVTEELTAHLRSCVRGAGFFTVATLLDGRDNLLPMRFATHTEVVETVCGLHGLAEREFVELLPDGALLTSPEHEAVKIRIRWVPSE